MSTRDTRLNSPGEMWARFVYVSRFFCFLAALVFGAIALSESSLVEAVKALLFVGLLLASQQWLKRTGNLERCDRDFNAVLSGHDLPRDELGVLLQRREALEERRGRPGFDPWEVQIVRREISDYVRKHPESVYRLDLER